MSKRGEASKLSKRFTALNTQYLRAYRQRVESDEYAESIIQTTKSNLKSENAKLPQNQHRQLTLMDLINAVDIQS